MENKFRGGQFKSLKIESAEGGRERRRMAEARGWL